MNPRVLRALTVIAGMGLGLCWYVARAEAGTYYIYSCSSYGNSAPAFTQIAGGANWDLADECDAGRSLEINQFTTVAGGHSSAWVADSPSAAIGIVGAYTPVNTVLVDCTLGADGFYADYAWSSGSQRIMAPSSCPGGDVGFADGIDTGFAPSSYFGWWVTCNGSSGCSSQVPGGKILGVQGVRLTAQENTGPSINPVPSNLWNQSGWVRGTWPITFDASDPSGVCDMGAVLDGTTVTSWGDSNPDTSSFTQCHGSELPGQLDTSGYSDGPHTLIYVASNAAAVVSAPSKTISIDNAPVSLSLSGPTDALSTAGTQYVSASASAGPSGVAAIFCSVDGSPYGRYAGSSAQVPVSGDGAHHVACYAQNNALDPSGTPATSPTETWDLTIREPTVAGISFGKVVDALRCHAVRARVKTRGRWVTVRHHHRLVRVRRRGHTRIVRVTRCHPRTVSRRVVVWKTVRRHGRTVRIKHTKVVRVVVPPHLDNRPTLRVGFGHGATVSGWIRLADGTALGDQPVRVLAAPDDGQQAFVQVAVVDSGVDGSWSARLPGGPSRLVEAVYDGSTTTEPATSSPVRLIVPARIRLKIRPTETHWGDRITIRGRVLGGYIPVGKFLRLRIGVAGVRETVGIPDVASTGRFRTTWTFAPGRGTVRYWFSVSTLREADYPYAPASSRRVTVTVGPG